MPPGPQRDVIKDTIKKTQESIEGIKKDLEAATLAAKSATVGMKKSKEETQKVNKFLSVFKDGVFSAAFCRNYWTWNWT